MEESFAAEHSGELLGNTLEKFLDGGRVTNESGAHLKATWRNVTNGGLNKKNIKRLYLNIFFFKFKILDKKKSGSDAFLIITNFVVSLTAKAWLFYDEVLHK